MFARTFGHRVHQTQGWLFHKDEEPEIAILLLDHEEFKMIPPAERCHLDLIDTRGVWLHMPVRTGTSLETISAETGVVFGKGRPHGLEA